MTILVIFGAVAVAILKILLAFAVFFIFADVWVMNVAYYKANGRRTISDCHISASIATGSYIAILLLACKVFA